MRNGARQKGIAKQVLDRLDFAIFVLEDSGQIVLCNRAAEKIVSAGHCLTVQEQCLVGRESIHQEAVHTLIANASRGETTGRVLCHPRQRIRLYAIGIPFDCSGFESRTSSLALLYIIDGRHTLECGDKLLCELLSLTPAETRLACSLVFGKTLAQHAAAAGIAVSTARSQLKQILAKTGMCRQVELVQLLARLPLLGENS